MEDRYLFRGKRIDNGEWVQGALFNGESHCIIGQEIKFSPYTEHECKIVGYEVDRDTICQCTGLKDKNGKLIWENDIVEKEFYTDYDAFANSERYVGTIKWTDCAAWEVVTDRCNILIAHELEFTDWKDHCKVIGNIFDNKELLESEE